MDVAVALTRAGKARGYWVKEVGEVSEFLYELQNPNPKYKKSHNAVLLDKNPVLFWQVVSATLFVALCICLIL